MRRHHRPPRSSAPDAAIIAFDVARRICERECAGCCQWSDPCKRHAGFVRGAQLAMAEYLRRAGVAT